MIKLTLQYNQAILCDVDSMKDKFKEATDITHIMAKTYAKEQVTIIIMIYPN